MKTLLFAPMYLDGGERLARNIKWVNYYTDLKNEGYIHFDEIYLVDNASSIQNKIEFIEKINGFVTIHERKIHFPRWQIHAYAYWYVAFARGIEYAIKNNFDKVAHIDTDVYLLNNKICDYVNEANNGWISFYSLMFNWPESTFQIICKDQLEKAYQFYNEDFLEFYPFDLAETRLPITHLEKSFKGDRYGECSPIPQDSSMDYYGQCHVGTEMTFNKGI